MRFGFVLAAASLSLLAATPALASEGGPSAEAAKARKHKPKCKKGKVLVKFGPKTRCVPLKSALPKPKGGDPRLAIVKEGLTPEIGHVPDPKNKIPPPAETAYRKFDPQALKAMEKVVGIAINRLDSMGAARARTLARPSRRAQASAESGNSFSTTIGGVQIDARLTIAIDATQQLVGTAEITQTRSLGGGKTVSVRTSMPIRLSHQGFEPKNGGCPTADGMVKAVDSIGVSVQTEFRSNNGKTLDEYYIYEVEDESDPLRGEVGDDAKLDSLEIKSIEEITEKAGGSIFGGSIVHGSIVRNTNVNMRTGAYEPHVVPVSVGVVLSGILRIFTPLIRSSVAERLKAAADKGFAASVKFEIERFRELEEKWNKPNACAKLEYGKKSRSVTLHRGDKGDETVKAEASTGGLPAKSTWTLVDRGIAEVGLAAGTANPTHFSYKVLAAGNGLVVKVTIKSVSKAGVAEDSWTQDTEQDSTAVISGNFSGEISMSTLKGPSVTSFNGSATFNRTTPDVIGGPNGSFDLFSGNVTIHVSGQEGLGVTACQWSGTTVVELPSGPASGGMSVFGEPPEYKEPYSYGIRIATPYGTEMTFTRHDCPEGAAEYEGTEQTIPIGAELDTGEEVSVDGIHYAGTNEETAGSSTKSETWAFEAQG